MPRWPGFIGASGVAQSLIADSEDTINWYVEKASAPNAKSPMALYPSPGFLPWGMSADRNGRAACNAGSRSFAVIGGTFGELTQGGQVFTALGQVVQDGNPAQCFYNGPVGGQVGIASGGNFYTFILATNTFAQQLTGVCTQTAYAAGFFFAFNINTGEVLVSALNDGTTWNNGIFFQRSLFPDPWQAIFVDQYNLFWGVGTETFEVWNNTGIGQQPWAPLVGLSGNFGICAPFAWCTTPLGSLWLTSTRQGVGQLVFTQGSTPKVVSTYPISTSIASYLRTASIGDVEMMSYEQEGHTFAVLHFPKVPVTWVYDIGDPSFTKRGVWNPQTGLWSLWAPRVILPAFGTMLAFDRTSGTIAKMDTTYVTEMDGVTGIVRERTTPGVTNEHQRVPIDQIELLMDVGLASQGPGPAPVATLRQSPDGGRTYGNELQASIGLVGQYRKRVFWSMLGAPADVVFKMRTTDPAPSRIIDAWYNNMEPLGGRRTA